MTVITKDIVENAKEYVIGLLETQLPEVCVFHSPAHTLDVFHNSQIIGREMMFSENDLNCLAVAAIFHDSGYIKSYDDHETHSCNIAREFLESKGIDESIIKQIEKAISATKVPQQPKDVISMALCDADLMHLTFDDYFERMLPMREEWKLTGRADLNEDDFHRTSIEFFGNHTYHTKYGKEVLAPKKELVLARIKARISK